ncbi:hypothetical protein FB451DRAFT_1518450 [Mycena latifolia]|nr:hypothetical protein FB451DRAFT_1518450 [Mycena latifolia]
MEIRTVLGEHLEQVERKAAAAMVIDGFHNREAEERGLACTQACKGLCHKCKRPHRIHEESLDWVVIARSECVGHGDAVVPRMDVPVHKRVPMHEAMDEVLPCVHCNPNRQWVQSDPNIELRKMYMATRYWKSGSAHQYIKYAAWQRVGSLSAPAKDSLRPAEKGASRRGLQPLLEQYIPNDNRTGDEIARHTFRRVVNAVAVQGRPPGNVEAVKKE